MKKYIFGLLSAVIAVFALSSCSADEGVERFGDKDAQITLYQLPVSAPFEADNDLLVRMACNHLVKEGYYVVLSEEDYKTLSDEAIANKAKSEGTKIELKEEKQNGGTYADIMVTGIEGQCYVAFAGFDGGSFTLKTIDFFGLVWEDVCKGIYTFSNSRVKIEPKEVMLQKCTNKSGVYRFKNLYGNGYSRKFILTEYADSDTNGNFTYIYTPSAETPYTFSSYGQVFTRDVYTWKGDINQLVWNKYYENNSIVIYTQYYVEAGSLGANDETFVPVE